MRYTTGRGGWISQIHSTCNILQGSRSHVTPQIRDSGEWGQSGGISPAPHSKRTTDKHRECQARDILVVYGQQCQLLPSVGGVSLDNKVHCTYDCGPGIHHLQRMVWYSKCRPRSHAVRSQERGNVLFCSVLTMASSHFPLHYIFIISFFFSFLSSSSSSSSSSQWHHFAVVPSLQASPS